MVTPRAVAFRKMKVMAVARSCSRYEAPSPTRYFSTKALKPALLISEAIRKAFMDGTDIGEASARRDDSERRARLPPVVEQPCIRLRRLLALLGLGVDIEMDLPTDVFYRRSNGSDAAIVDADVDTAW